MSEPQPQHPAAIDVGGTPYLRDAKGSLVPIATISRTVRSDLAERSDPHRAADPGLRLCRVACEIEHPRGIRRT